MRLLVCGDRNWVDDESIKEAIVRLNPSVVIHGNARGADSLAGEAANSLGITVEVYPAQWETYGRAAGPIRNRQMLVDGKPDKVLAFHDDIEKSKGTKNMVKQAEKAGIDVTIYNHDYRVDENHRAWVERFEAEKKKK